MEFFLEKRDKSDEDKRWPISYMKEIRPSFIMNKKQLIS